MQGHQALAGGAPGGFIGKTAMRLQASSSVVPAAPGRLAGIEPVLPEAPLALVAILAMGPVPQLPER